jgi:hypothetical protein
MQRGSLAMVSRKEPPSVWQLRWSEKNLHGVRVQRKRVIGSVERYPDEAVARSAVTVLLAEINSDKVRMSSRSISEIRSTLLAGTTRLELATSAVTATTWKNTDGTRSRWKYVVDNVIVYREGLWELWRGQRVISELPNQSVDSCRSCVGSIATSRNSCLFDSPLTPSRYGAWPGPELEVVCPLAASSRTLGQL